MAVREIKSREQYIGLSTDTKPTANVGFGSIFRETDTGTRYEFDGSTWNRIPYMEIEGVYS